MTNYELLQEEVSQLPYNQDNPPEKYIPIKIGKIVFIFGGCFGIALIEKMVYELVEDDGSWYVGDTDVYSTGWFDDKIKILQTAKEYLLNHGKPYYYVDTNIICGYAVE